MRTKAYTRAVSPRLAGCALTHMPLASIDAARAASQHAAYEQALADAGLQIERLPDLDDAPDGVFVEDTAILLGGHAIITRPGASSRGGEVESTARILAENFTVHRLAAGTLDGGDVLRIGRNIYVGLSTRTDKIAISDLQQLAEPLGYSVIPVEVRGCLHLKTAATCAGRDGSGGLTLLVNPAWIDPDAFEGVEPLPVPSSEPFAANSLRVGETLFIAAGSPATRDTLAARGFNPVELDISELQKAEAGLTCMGILQE